MSFDITTYSVWDNSDVRVIGQYHSAGTYSVKNLGPYPVYVSEKANSNTTDFSLGNNTLTILPGETIQVVFDNDFGQTSFGLYARCTEDGTSIVKSWRS